MKLLAGEKEGLLKLHTNKALIADPVFRPLVEKYAALTDRDEIIDSPIVSNSSARVQEEILNDGGGQGDTVPVLVPTRQSQRTTRPPNRFKRKLLLDPNTIHKTQTRATVWSTVGEHQGQKLRTKSVEIINGDCFEKIEQLIECLTSGTGSDQSQNNVEGNRRENNVGVCKAFSSRGGLILTVDSPMAACDCGFADWGWGSPVGMFEDDWGSDLMIYMVKNIAICSPCIWFLIVDLVSLLIRMELSSDDVEKQDLRRL
ncbi:hypothetical protein Ccrd_022390 [Cynara cardunculus var. scolymus]|uniref:Uncharacterized protein n=1 Tax=Cynara cardunculus var. scolymus TaxID=59895 RepID=A0A103XYX6_CYNCS|nr:hypothetical protein Ccrd_022390 [Cynara cardunculus var. scolymus]